MIVTSLAVKGFKNLENVSISPSSGYNLLLGSNAQGKTNIIESIWLMTGCRSFRGSKQRDCIKIDENSYSIKLKFEDKRRDQCLEMSVFRENIQKRDIKVNGVSVKGTSALFDRFKCILFTPDDIDFVKGSPEKRRSFLDLCCSQFSASALRKISDYQSLIAQRNIALKDISYGKYKADTLFIWDEQMATICADIWKLRLNYIEKLDTSCSELYKNITNRKESLTVTYKPNCFPVNDIKNMSENEIKEKFFTKLRNSEKDDIRLGFTQYGIHRDDFIFAIDDMPVKDFGSQGQQKSTALVMKLAQANIFRDNRKEPPVILLDDVMGQLDTVRQRLIGEIIKDSQVFISACNENAVELNNSVRVFNVRNGGID